MMNQHIPKMVFICSFALHFFFSLPVYSEPFRSINHDDLLISTELKDRILKLSLEYRGTFWPDKGQLDLKLKNDDITERVKDAADKWIRIILRKDWVPDDLKENFIPLRLSIPTIPPENVDYLITRYEINNYYIQIMENGAAVELLIVPVNRDISDTSTVDYLKKMVEQFINIPHEQIKDIIIKNHNESPNDTLYYGTVDCIDIDKGGSRKWWNHSYAFSDGSCIYLGIVECNGTPQKPQSRPGIADRF
jgi:hypothetical protein